MTQATFRRVGLPALVSCVALALGACAPHHNVKRAEGQVAQLVGPRVTRNTTPLESAFQCMSVALRDAQPVAPKIGVGQVRDYTGKFSELDGGSAITQGGSLMAVSALGKLRGAVRVFERFDTQVAEWELGFSSKRYLGDERPHAVNTNGQVQQVPWKPYLGGTVVETDYFIIGGITELNFAIHSHGARAEVNQIGPSARSFVANVAVDLRMVDTRTLEVLQTVTLQKQVVGYEISLSVFEFFGDTLVDFEAGGKHNEPLQLAVRTTIEQAVLELLGPLAQMDAQTCIDYRPQDLQLARQSAPMPLPSRKLGDSPVASPASAPAAAPADAPVSGTDPDAEPASPAAAAPRPAAAVPLHAMPPQTGRPEHDGDQPGPRGIGPDASRRPREETAP